MYLLSDFIPKEPIAIKSKIPRVMIRVKSTKNLASFLLDAIVDLIESKLIFCIVSS